LRVAAHEIAPKMPPLGALDLCKPGFRVVSAQWCAFIETYNNQRYHESLDNLTPADVYYGRAKTILLERERIKHQTIERRRLRHQRQAA